MILIQKQITVQYDFIVESNDVGTRFVAKTRRSLLILYELSASVTRTETSELKRRAS